MSRQTRMITLHPQDNVAIALADMSVGETGSAAGPTLLQSVKQGHKVAVVPIKAGQNVLRYGQIIGQAQVDIAAGEHVHIQNLGMGEHSRDYAYASEATDLGGAPDVRTFEGYHRADGRVGTRNYLGILTSVNCSGSVARFIAEAAEKSGLLDAFPNIDGIVPITHGTGCGMSGVNEGYDTLFRTIAGYAQHPNFGGILLIGLGCEVMQVSALVGGRPIRADGALRYMTIQQEGGTRKTIEKGLTELRGIAELTNKATRQAKSTYRTVRMLAPAEINRDAEFAFRHESRPNMAFTRTLAQALRNGGTLDHILVWDEEENGKATGRLVLLDGAHRLAAYLRGN